MTDFLNALLTQDSSEIWKNYPTLWRGVRVAD
jgi:hypothetical protein